MGILGALLIILYYSYFWYNELAYEYEIMQNAKNYDVKKNTVYAIDFDGTIAYTKYPKIIKPIPYAIQVLQILSKHPNSTLILWTCREGKELEDALSWCAKYNVYFDYVNENDKDRIKLYGNDCRKIGADIYIDDKSYQGFNGIKQLWHYWYDWLKDNGF